MGQCPGSFTLEKIPCCITAQCIVPATRVFDKTNKKMLWFISRGGRGPLMKTCKGNVTYPTFYFYSKDTKCWKHSAGQAVLVCELDYFHQTSIQPLFPDVRPGL